MLYLPQFVSQSVWFVEKALLPGATFTPPRLALRDLPTPPRFHVRARIPQAPEFGVSERPSVAVLIGTGRMQAESHPGDGLIILVRSLFEIHLCVRGARASLPWTGFLRRLLNPGQAYFSSTVGTLLLKASRLYHSCSEEASGRSQMKTISSMHCTALR